MKEKISKDKHITYGQKLYEIRDIVLDQDLLCMLPKSSKQYKLMKKAYAVIDELRSEMDNVACRDFPQDRSASQWYYPGNVIKRIP